MMNNGAKELWAVVSVEDGTILYSRGGSSSRKKLLVYPTEGKAKGVLNHVWTKHVIPDKEKVAVKRIYSATRTIGGETA